MEKLPIEGGKEYYVAMKIYGSKLYFSHIRIDVLKQSTNGYGYSVKMHKINDPYYRHDEWLHHINKKYLEYRFLPVKKVDK